MKTIKRKMLVIMLSVAVALCGAMTVITAMTANNIPKAGADTTTTSTDDSDMFFMAGAQACNLTNAQSSGETTDGVPILFLRFVLCVDPNVTSSVLFSLEKGNPDGASMYCPFYLKVDNTTGHSVYESYISKNVVESGTEMNNGMYQVSCFVYCRTFAAIDREVQVVATGYDSSKNITAGASSSTRSILGIWQAIDADDNYDNSFNSKAATGFVKSMINSYNDGFLESAQVGVYSKISTYSGSSSTISSKNFGLENLTNLMFRVSDLYNVFNGMQINFVFGSSNSEMDFGISRDGITFSADINGTIMSESEYFDFISNTFQIVAIERVVGETKKYDLYFRIKDLSEITKRFTLENFGMGCYWNGNASKSDEIEIYAAAIPVYDEYNNALLEEKQNVNEQLLAAKAEINTLENTVYEKNLAIVDLNARITDLNSEIDAKESTIENLNSQIATLESEKSSLENQLKLTENNLETANKNLVNKQSELDALQNDYDAYKQEVAEKYQEYETTIKKLTESNGNYSEALDELKKEYSEYKTTSEQTIKQKELDITSLNVQIATLNSNISTLQKDKESLNNTIKEKDTLISQKDSLIKTNEEEIKKLNEDIATKQSNIDELNEEVEYLNGEIEAKQKAYDTVISQAGEDKSELLNTIGSLTAENEKLSSELKKIEKENEELKLQQKDETKDSGFEASCTGTIMSAGNIIVFGVAATIMIITLLIKARKRRNEND